MNPENPGNGPDSSSNILIKRKRGRPRKDQNQNITRIANILSIRTQIQHQEDNSPTPPGFATVNGNHSPQENTVAHHANDIVGQRVTGVVEATFDAGYLLSVRIGNSETSLRGIVFKPGHYVPVSSENDVAPQIEMINRNTVPIPAEFHTPVHGSYRRGRGRGRARNESRFSYSGNGSSAGNQLEIVPVQPSAVGDKVTLVPAVSNGVNLPVMENQRIVSTARPVNQTLNSQIKTDDEKMQDLSPPLSVEPLQSIHTEFFNPSPSVNQNLREARAGKMTELLLAVQEKVIDKQATDVLQHQNLEHHQN